MATHSPFFALGLGGYPLGHSLSPRLHQAALRACGLRGEYRLYPVPPLPEGQACLERLIQDLRSGQLSGLNITIPHKQSVLQYLDDLTPLAAQIGAINTIYRQNGCLVGDNTDAPGFMADLIEKFPSAALNDQDGSPKAALVLGAGGSARAVVYALLSAGWQVTVAARRTEMALEILNRYASSQLSTVNSQPGSILARSNVIALELLAQYFQDGIFHPRKLTEPTLSTRQGALLPLSLIVNTTPVGMTPQVDHSPWPGDLSFPRGVFVYDLVYNPVNTALVQAARAAGLMAATGLGMLIQQAARSFERWTGLRPDIHSMYQAVADDREGHGTFYVTHPMFN